ncbi:MAG: hypothetical protein HRT88_15645 [Lentisphaeraceae bacterium]|nr:hypothetical protein [Lentisphaeraceae bacterium]
MAVQQGGISLRKDDESTFFIAHITGDVIIPQDINALEMSAPPIIGELVAEVEKIAPKKNEVILSTDMPPKIEEGLPNSLELVVRLKFDEKPDEEKLSKIYEVVTKAISGAIRKLRNEK